MKAGDIVTVGIKCPACGGRPQPPPEKNSERSACSVSRSSSQMSEHACQFWGVVPSFADGQIAAIAAVNDLTLVTANTAHFANFAGLEVANWLGE